MLTPLPLLVLGPIILGLALSAELHWLLIADLILVVFPGTWSVAGVLFDPTDLVLAGIALHLAVRKRRGGTSQGQSIPYLALWVLLGLLMSAGYLNADQNRAYLTDPVRVAYQLYRYAWRPILYYPLSIVLLRDRSRLQAVLLAVVVAADAYSVQATFQGYYYGVRATGPFERGSNALGALLIVPFLLSLSTLIETASRGQWVFYSTSIVLMGRALLFSASRGATVSLVAGAGLLLCGLASEQHYFRRVIKLAAMGVLGIVLMLPFKPDMFEGPNLRRVLTAITDTTQTDTFRWRWEERWPHFWRKVVANPWLGIGTDVDPSLGENTNTPHNGYLSLAVKHGVPVLLIFACFGFLALGDGLRAFRGSQDPWQRTLGLTVAAGTAGLLIHNVVDSILLVPFTAKLFWMLAAIAAIVARPTGRGLVPVTLTRHLRGAPLSLPDAGQQQRGSPREGK